VTTVVHVLLVGLQWSAMGFCFALGAIIAARIMDVDV
jgi:hypothetical protein